MTERLLTIREAAKMLGVSEQYARRLVAAGELTGQKIGRDWVIVRESVLDYAERVAPQKKPGRPPKLEN